MAPDEHKKSPDICLDSYAILPFNRRSIIYII